MFRLANLLSCTTVSLKRHLQCFSSYFLLFLFCNCADLLLAVLTLRDFLFFFFFFWKGSNKILSVVPFLFSRGMVVTRISVFYLRAGCVDPQVRKGWGELWPWYRSVQMKVLGTEWEFRAAAVPLLVLSVLWLTESIELSWFSSVLHLISSHMASEDIFACWAVLFCSRFPRQTQKSRKFGS